MPSALLASAVFLASCTISSDAGNAGDAELAIDKSRTSITHANGLSANGIAMNGIAMNGIAMNGIAMNGIAMNGIAMNGIAMNGIAMNGIAMNGLYINGIAMNGVELDGMGVSQIGVNGPGTNGIVITGIGLQGTGEGTIGASSAGMDGLDLAGASINGLYIHGAGENGIGVGSAGLRDLGLDGLRINGTGGLQILAAGGAGRVDFSSERETVLEVVLYHLAGCALPAGDSATLTAADGSPRTYHGLRGLAPEWKTGPLSQDGEERVRACLESSPVATSGLALNAEQETNLHKLFAYLAQCALSADQSVTIYAGDGTPRTYAGSLGLAPEWRDGPLSPAGERRVSACLAARTNALAQTVSLSLRHADLPITDVEADLYTTHEGAFWGNLFAPQASIKACMVNGGGLSGRVCTESGSCGFELMGDCADVCAHYDPIQGYSQCGDEQETAVINTFLNLGQRLTFGQNELCTIESGSLWCWGDNRHGQLATGDTQAPAAPVQVSALDSEVVEAAINSHACARKHDGSLWCWGRNDQGQVGNGTRTEQHGPVQVADDVATFAIGDRHTCSIQTDGSVQCWGANNQGQLGIGTNAARRDQPTPVAGLSSVARLASSTTARHTCALENDGDVWCWGANDNGQLGDGTRTRRNQPVQVTVDEQQKTFGEATDMCASRDMTCARKTDGTMWCWGQEVALQPRHMASGVAPGGLACGEQHACFVSESDSTVSCFGRNNHGQLGSGTQLASNLQPVQVPGLDAVSHVNAGRTHTCATRVDGSLWCWGRDPGREGKGVALFPSELSSTPMRIDLTLP